MKLSMVATILMASISFHQSFGLVTRGLKSEKETVSADGALVKLIDAGPAQAEPGDVPDSPVAPVRVDIQADSNV